MVGTLGCDVFGTSGRETRHPSKRLTNGAEYVILITVMRMAMDTMRKQAKPPTLVAAIPFEVVVSIASQLRGLTFSEESVR